MAKSNSSLCSPANKALLHFFDEMTTFDLDIAQGTALNNVATKESEKSTQQSTKYCAENNNLQQLIDKASALEQLINKPEHVDAIPNNSLLNPNITKDDKASIIEKVLPKHQVNTNIADTTNKYVDKHLTASLQENLAASFPVLLCEVAGVNIALPLVELGGIHLLGKITNIAKKPSWCLGIMMKGDDKYTCIDASAWLVPNCIAKKTAASPNYRFAVQLGKTPYVLCCNEIITTIELSKDDIKWRENLHKRPWLAGFLKEKKCALLDGAKMVQDVLSH